MIATLPMTAPKGRIFGRLLGMCLLGMCLLTTGCFKAPEVVIVDRRTALEEQALGRHPKRESELQQAGLSPRPAAFTRQQLEKSGWRPDRDHDAITALFEQAVADGERVDQLLLRKCIGEAETGLLTDTRSACSGGVDAGEVAQLIERVNRNRRQIWAYLAGARRATVASARAAWHAVHLVELVCGGHLQKGGKWTTKTCDE